MPTEGVRLVEEKPTLSSVEQSQFPDDAIEAVAKAIERSVHERAKGLIETQPPPDWDDLLDYYAGLMPESDRAVPILAYAFIDTEIAALMKRAMNPHMSGGPERLFQPLAPLGTASSRLALCEGLGWLNAETVADLHILRRIRNHFAHSRGTDGLNDPRTRDLIQNHQLLGRMLDTAFPTDEEHPHRMFDVLTVRSRVIVAAALSAWTTAAQLYVAPASIRVGIDPSELLRPGAAMAPEGIVNQYESTRTLLLFMARIVKTNEGEFSGQ